MDREHIPEGWIGSSVQLEVWKGGSGVETRSGRLWDVSEFGATLETPHSGAHTFYFYPWSAVLAIVLRQDQDEEA